MASKFTSITGRFGRKVKLSHGGDSAKNLRLTASKESLPNNSNVLVEIQNGSTTKTEAMQQAAAEIGQFARRFYGIDDEMAIADQDDLNCFQAVADLDKMGLLAMTEIVMDSECFRNVVYLFLLPRLGPEVDHAAIEQ